jgi:hypothetical protein
MRGSAVSIGTKLYTISAYQMIISFEDASWRQRLHKHNCVRLIWRTYSCARPCSPRYFFLSMLIVDLFQARNSNFSLADDVEADSGAITVLRSV